MSSSRDALRARAAAAKQARKEAERADSSNLITDIVSEMEKPILEESKPESAEIKENVTLQAAEKAQKNDIEVEKAPQNRLNQTILTEKKTEIEEKAPTREEKKPVKRAGRPSHKEKTGKSTIFKSVALEEDIFDYVNHECHRYAMSSTEYINFILRSYMTKYPAKGAVELPPEV